MNDMPQDAWFYSHEGERIGPVTFADLQIKAKEGALNPRLDLVWKHGMDEWKPSGEIEGLFERRAAPEEKESLAPEADSYKASQQESAEERMLRETGWPGARRRSFLAATIFFPGLWAFGTTAASGILGKEFGPEIMKFAAIGLPLVPLVVVIYFTVRRLVNVGMSGWWILGNLVPLLNLWVGYRCFACPAGYAYHKKLDGVGVFLAIIYWLLILVGILAITAVIAALFGVIGSPEIQEQIREGIRQANEMAHKK